MATIATVEAMKMETTITAAVSGTLQIEVQEGERFDNNAGVRRYCIAHAR